MLLFRNEGNRRGLREDCCGLDIGLVHERAGSCHSLADERLMRETCFIRNYATAAPWNGRHADPGRALRIKLGAGNT